MALKSPIFRPSRSLGASHTTAYVNLNLNLNLRYTFLETGGLTTKPILALHQEKMSWCSAKVVWGRYLPKFRGKCTSSEGNIKSMINVTFWAPVRKTGHHGHGQESGGLDSTSAQRATHDRQQGQGGGTIASHGSEWYGALFAKERKHGNGEAKISHGG